MAQKHPELSRFARATLKRTCMLVRHAQSTANVDGEVYYHVPFQDIPLSAEGIKQSQRVAPVWDALHGTVLVVTTDFVRTNQTAQHMGLFNQNHLVWQNFKNLGELVWDDYGKGDNAEYRARHTAFLKKWKTEQEQGKYCCFETAPNGHETPRQGGVRLLEPLEHIAQFAEKHQYAHVVIVGHSLSNNVIRMLVEGEGPDYFERTPYGGNASVLRLSDNTWLHEGFQHAL